MPSVGGRKAAAPRRRSSSGWPLLLSLWLLSCRASAQEGTLRFAELGDCTLASGAVIHDCRIGYRTWGALNAARDNAVLFTTWFTGTSASLADSIGPGKLVDPRRLFVIGVDALGNGASSSPSNSPSQARTNFPVFTIRDLVETQRRLLVEVLNVTHLRAVMGISMGGMQSFQWVVSHPDFMDRAVPILGTPRQTARDLLLWRAMLSAIRSDPAYRGGDYAEPPVLATAADIAELNLRTPKYLAEHVPAERYPAFAEEIEARDRFDANDRVRQLEAMIAHDVGATAGGSLEQAAARVKARMLIVVALQDQMVNPLPALAFARLVGAETLVLDDECGHLALDCEGERVNAAVRRFLLEEEGGASRP
jgi:homoserine O-acetyltransferase